MIAGVVSEHVVELHIIDLVGCLCLEALLNNRQLLLAHLHFEVVKDGAEASEGDEAAAAPVFVLEVRLNQQTAMLDVNTEALEHGDEDALLLIIEHILGVKDRGRGELSRHCQRVLLDSLVGEDVVELVAEGDIVDEASVVGHREMLFQLLKLSWCEQDALSVEGTTEFLGGEVALPEVIVILEEL